MDTLFDKLESDIVDCLMLVPEDFIKETTASLSDYEWVYPRMNKALTFNREPANEEWRTKNGDPKPYPTFLLGMRLLGWQPVEMAGVDYD